ncbi:MAG: metalloenzyme [Lentisphaeria bacterium]|nr:metalloenzyme [Candidatus Neomarinimicrobiota bacterium]MCF7842391.1 metalloenzyme [Lentisphaeria bacterium]
MLKNILLIIMDSARYDVVAAAKTPNMDQLGTLERRWSYSSWTFPAHHVFLMGLMPHKSPTRIHASNVYRQEYSQWQQRTGIKEINFSDFTPQLSLPLFLQKRGFRNEALVSMPVLNPATNLNQYFHRYLLMEKHNDFSGMIEMIHPVPGQPTFYFLNLGETHYPYSIQGADEEDMPHLHGVHGTLKHFPEPESGEWFSDDQFQSMKQAQQRAVAAIDQYLPVLLHKFKGLPTHVIITADHGELFGEGGCFGHGPIQHPKVFEVPFLEGELPTE